MIESQVSVPAGGGDSGGGGDRDRGPRRGEHVQHPGEQPGQLGRGHDAVEQAVREQVLRGLHAGRELPAVQGGVDARAEERDQCARLGQGELPSEPQEANTPPVVGCRR